MSAKSLKYLVPAHGLEPRFTPSKGAVLPLDEAGKGNVGLPLAGSAGGINATGELSVRFRPAATGQFGKLTAGSSHR